MNSFMSWIGGKKALRNKILEQFPEKKTFNSFIEVFGGAGWVLFSSDKHAKLEIYNDINGNLINLFRCIKYHPEAVQKELEFVRMSREQFFDAKERIESRGQTDIQRAAMFFILIKESYGTDLHSFGVSSKNMEKAKEYLGRVSERLCSVVIENLDFQRIIKNYDKPDALFYFDPPYYGTEKYYQDGFGLDDHIRLKKSLDNMKGKFLLSYNDCDYIKELYQDYVIIEVNRVHNLIKKKIRPRYKELIIKNY